MTFIASQGSYWDDAWGLFGTRIWAALEAGGGGWRCDSLRQQSEALFMEYSLYTTSLRPFGCGCLC